MSLALFSAFAKEEDKAKLKIGAKTREKRRKNVDSRLIPAGLGSTAGQRVEGRIEVDQVHRLVLLAAPQDIDGSCLRIPDKGCR
jgi:hypothetical protein